ncbi:hypothetical protein CHS0354_009655 [Potamilus streckersoni]|uniref:RING-CH-type domain-containing protein n=1 Tax=Potamilus streckersoni TaxID=2493646 RepID=A0AAE0S456_9BIVA|nr:hypothetical protein CHS0354_009655 [Potamilus streckersoni]
MFRADDQNSEDKSEKFSMTEIHFKEIYSTNCEQCIREIDKDGNGEMKIIKPMKSDEIPCYIVDSHNFLSPSQQITDSFLEVGNSEVKDNGITKQHDLQDVARESISFRNDVTGDVYQCKYCTEESKDEDSLFTPCRCSGSLGYVHKHCLETWMRVRSEGSFETELRCEICGYRFYRQKHYKWTRFSCSELNRCDRWLYSVVIICLLVVIGSVSALVFCFIEDRPLAKKYSESKIDQLVAFSGNTNEINRALGTYSLSTLDNIKIVCAAVCIVFITVCVFLTKLCKVPPHKLILRHVQSNEQWTALPYSASRDSLVMGNVANV